MNKDTGESQDLIHANSKDIPRSLKDMENRRIMQALTPGKRLPLIFSAKLPSVKENIRMIKKR